MKYGIVKKILLGLAVLFLFEGCRTSPSVLPDSSMQFVAKETEVGPKFEEPKEVYIEEKVLAIDTDIKKNHDGSLFRDDEERAELFSTVLPQVPGRYIDVKMVAMSSKNLGSLKEAQQAEQDNAEQVGDIDGDLNKIVAELPDLSQEQIDSLRLMKHASFKIENVLPNGDLKVKYERESVTDEEYNNISVEALIPWKKAYDKHQPNTGDLRDIRLVQQGFDGNIIRESVNWQDEYTVRMSGFTEARTESAKRLEEKRQRLVKTKEKVYNKAVEMNKERVKLSKEREGILELKAQIAAENADLKKTNADLENKIEKLQKDLEDKEREEQPEPADAQAGGG